MIGAGPTIIASAGGGVTLAAEPDTGPARPPAGTGLALRGEPAVTPAGPAGGRRGTVATEARGRGPEPAPTAVVGAGTADARRCATNGALVIAARGGPGQAVTTDTGGRRAAAARRDGGAGARNDTTVRPDRAMTAGARSAMIAARPCADAGFTLIEALIAMAVLAVAAAGLVRATGGHVDAVAALTTRVAAGLAADNALAGARLGLAPATSSLLGRDWRAAVTRRASDDPAIAALTVAAASGDTRVTLRGFRDMAPAVGAPAGANDRIAVAGGRAGPADGFGTPTASEPTPPAANVAIPPAAGDAPPVPGDRIAGPADDPTAGDAASDRSARIDGRSLWDTQGSVRSATATISGADARAAGVDRDAVADDPVVDRVSMAYGRMAPHAGARSLLAAVVTMRSPNRRAAGIGRAMAAEGLMVEGAEDRPVFAATGTILMTRTILAADDRRDGWRDPSAGDPVRSDGWPKPLGPAVALREAAAAPLEAGVAASATAVAPVAMAVVR